MDFEKTLTQIKEGWAKIGPRTRVGIGAGAGAVLVAVVVVLVLSRTQYGMLYRMEDPSETAEVVAALEGAGITHRLGAGGLVVEVPKQDIDRARMLLAADGLPSGGSVGFSDIYDDPDPGTTRETERVNFLRALQGELQRSITSLDAVHGARIHLTLPKPTVFRAEASAPTASVVVDLRGRELSRANVAAIQNLVAASVERLEPAKVVVVTTDGQRLSGVGADESGEALDYKRQLEKDLEREISHQLEQIVGLGGVSASVEADIDFSRTNTREENVDPEQTAVLSEVDEEVREGAGGNRPGGVAGAVANEPGATQAGGAGSRAQSSRKVVSKNYEVARTVVETSGPKAQLRRLTVSVLVDGTLAASEDGAEAVFSPRTPEELAEFQKLVENAVGFDSARGDRVTVQSSRFVGRPPIGGEILPDPPLYPAWAPYAGGGVLALLAAAGVVFMRRRRAKPVTAEVLAYPVRVDEAQRALEAAQAGATLTQAVAAAGPQAALPAGSTTMDELRDQVIAAAEENPERAAEVVKAWMNEDAA